MSGNGMRVAIGGYYNNGANVTDTGHVRVYEYQATNWVQLGADIDGEAMYDQSGYSVAMSSNGSEWLSVPL